jgi:putative transposase
LPEIIRLAVMINGRETLSLQNVEDLLNERGNDIIYESKRPVVALCQLFSG